MKRCSWIHRITLFLIIYAKSLQSCQLIEGLGQFRKGLRLRVDCIIIYNNSDLRNKMKKKYLILLSRFIKVGILCMLLGITVETSGLSILSKRKINGKLKVLSIASCRKNISHNTLQVRIIYLLNTLNNKGNNHETKSNQKREWYGIQDASFSA